MDNYNYEDNINNAINEVGATATQLKENMKDNMKDVKDRVTDATGKLSDQASELKDKLSTSAKTYGETLTRKIDDVRGKASTSLLNSSEKIQNLAVYLDEHDTKDMTETATRNTRQVIVNNPGTTILVSVAFGILLGVLFKQNNR